MSDAIVQTTTDAPRILGPARSRIKVSDVWTTAPVARMIGMRDIKVKYKQAALGPLWLLIAPLGLLAAMIIAFSGVTTVNTSGIPYVPFALVGLTVWSFVQLSLSMGAQAVIANSSLVRRSILPRLSLMTGSLLGNLPPMLVMLVVALISAAATGSLAIQVLLLPVMLLWLFVFTFGVTLLLSAIAARYRDTVSIIPLVVQAGIFVTPVGYGLRGAPSNIHTLLAINPVSGIIEAWRWCVVDLPNPQVGVILAGIGWTALLVVVGWRTFGRMEVDFADFV
jgi:ABC-type polysaccharide/polyol phosphate export permease